MSGDHVKAKGNPFPDALKPFEEDINKIFNKRHSVETHHALLIAKFKMFFDRATGATFDEQVNNAGKLFFGWFYQNYFRKVSFADSEADTTKEPETTDEETDTILVQLNATLNCLRPYIKLLGLPYVLFIKTEPSIKDNVVKEHLEHMLFLENSKLYNLRNMSNEENSDEEKSDERLKIQEERINELTKWLDVWTKIQECDHNTDEFIHVLADILRGFNHVISLDDKMNQRITVGKLKDAIAAGEFNEPATIVKLNNAIAAGELSDELAIDKFNEVLTTILSAFNHVIEEMRSEVMRDTLLRHLNKELNEFLSAFYMEYIECHDSLRPNARVHEYTVRKLYTHIHTVKMLFFEKMTEALIGHALHHYRKDEKRVECVERVERVERVEGCRGGAGGGV